MLEALYTGSTTWITASALSPYVTNTSLTTTLGSYALSTTLNNYVTTSSLTTTLGSYLSLSVGTFTGDISLGTHSLKFTNASAVPRTIDQTMLEVLYTGSSTWITASALSPYVTTSSLTTTLGSYMPLSGGTFTGDISLGVNNIKYINIGGTTRSIDRTLLEALYNGATTWLTAGSLAPYMLKAGGTFTGNVTMSGATFDLGTNSLKFTNTSSLGRVMSQAILEALYNGATSWITATQIPAPICREEQL